jgi:hypothetical protein
MNIAPKNKYIPRTCNRCGNKWNFDCCDYSYKAIEVPLNTVQTIPESNALNKIFTNYKIYKNNKKMKLVKGSAEAKKYMASIRAKKKTVKKPTAKKIGYSKDRLKIVKETTKEFNKLIKKNPTAKKNRAKSLSIAQLNASIKLRKKYPYVDPYSKKGNLGSVNKNQPKIDRNKSNIDYINYCLDRIRVYNNNIEFHKENIKNTKDPYIKKRAKFEIKDTQMMIKELKQAITKTKKHIK